MLLAAGQQFVGPHAAGGGIRAVAIGMIEAGQPPAVGIVVRAGVHPDDRGFVSAVWPRRPEPIGRKDWRR